MTQTDRQIPPKKKDVELIVCDIDNTLSDFFNKWADTLDYAVTELAKSRKIEKKVIFDDIKENVAGHNQFYDMTGLIRESRVLFPKTQEEARRFEKDDQRIIHECDRRRGRDKMFDGVLVTLKKAKKQGAKVVMYTDAPMELALLRLSSMKMPSDMVDGLYARPEGGSNAEESRYLRPLLSTKKSRAYRKALGDSLVELKDEWKPNPETFKRILKDHGVTDPSRAVMVGDNIKSDGGSAIPAGADFAWQKSGGAVTPKAQDVYQAINRMTEYKVGTEAQMSQINDQNRPTVVLEKNFAELAKHYNFVAPKNTTKEKTNILTGLRHKIRQGGHR